MLDLILAGILLLNRGEMDCLAQNIYHEARGESLEGQLAVAHVVFNRTHSHKFPSTYCDVIHQAETWQGYPIRNRCQFSWYCDGKSDLFQDIKSYRIAIENAKLAWRTYYINGFDLSNGADHYHATHVDPYWNDSMHLTINIGNHLFYKSE